MAKYKFHPSHVQLLSSNVYLSDFKTPKMGLGDISDLTYSTRVRYQFIPVDLENGLVSAYLEAYISLDSYQDAGYSIGSNFLFRIFKAKENIIQTRKKNVLNITYDPLLEDTLATESYSTLRGLSIPTISQTAYRGLYLPVVHADQILDSERIPGEELLEKLKPATKPGL